MTKQLVAIILASFFMLFIIAGCQEPPEEESANTDISQNGKQTELKPKTPKAVKIVKQRTTARTWSEIKASGQINAVKLDWKLESALPRAGSTGAYHSTLLQSFADSRGLKITWHRVTNLAGMFEKLSAFEVDIIPRHLTITPNRLDKYSFTYPLLRDKEVVIAKSGKHDFNEDDDNSIYLPIGSAYIDSVTKQYPHWKINIIEAVSYTHLTLPTKRIV